MCGVSVLVDPRGISSRSLAAMAALARHRGPDDEGYALFTEDQAMPLGGDDTPATVADIGTTYAPRGSIGALAPSGLVNPALGHRRLAILDVSDLGHEPMCSSEGRYWITYNGEVYNFIELRTELESSGDVFVSDTDTEVILAAYRRWGPACLSRFNGMFAFAIFDTVQRTLFVARDPFGIKPLYYWALPSGGLAFASEIKQFTVLPGWRSHPNGQRVYDFLVWGVQDHTDETMFAGIYQLPAGHSALLQVDQPEAALLPDGRLRSSAWYTLRPSDYQGPPSAAATQVRALLTDAVRLRLRADVPVGSCLSGGIDSSSIVCLVDEALRATGVAGAQRTFSAYTPDVRLNERAWVEQVLKFTSVTGHNVTPERAGLFEELSRVTWHQDEPFGSTSIYAQWNVFRLAADHGVTVMLDGQGADEQFAGYQSFYGPRLAGLLTSGHLLTLGREGAALKRVGVTPSEAVQRLANVLLPERARDTVRRLQGRSTATMSWLDADRLGAVPIKPAAARATTEARTIRETSFAQLTATSLPMLLHWEDRDSMAHSVEARVPFVDHRLVEYVLGLPDDHKISDGWTKYVLRQAMSGRIPDAIRDRTDKIGFATPEELWMRQAAPEFRARLGKAIELTQGAVRPSALDDFDHFLDKRIEFNQVPWRQISLGEWVEVMDVRW
jgi:asparagine synthase (glutamine-hydrolysing)